MKECKVCGNQFEPKNEKRGHEQIYCSIKCRGDAYKKRVMERININKDEVEINTRATNLQRAEYRPNIGGGSFPVTNLEIIEGKYQSEVKALEWKMQYERALDKIEELKAEIEDYKRDIGELEGELDSYRDKEDKPNANGWLGFVQSSPEIGVGVGKLLQHDKVQNFILGLIPEVQKA